MPVAVTLGYVTLVAAFGSSIFSTATATVASEFNISREVGILGVSLYVLGFATGELKRILFGDRRSGTPSPPFYKRNFSGKGPEARQKRLTRACTSARRVSNAKDRKGGEGCFAFFCHPRGISCD